jgi:2-dehydropantoate 2-reductase
MRVAVLGSGAMGSIFGAALSRAGAEVVFFDRRRETVEAINRDGLRLTGVLGEFTVGPSPPLRGRDGEGGSMKAAEVSFPPPYPSPARGEGMPLATSDPKAIGKVDVALVLVDSNATAEVAGIAAECLTPDGFALTLQNGIGNYEALAERLGEGRVLAGSTFNSGAGRGAGGAAHTNLGPSWLGELDGRISARATAIAERFIAAGLPFEVVDNVRGVVWSKFVHNCAINPIAAVTGLRSGEIARNAAAAALLDRVLDEVLAVVAASGVTLPEGDPREHIHDHCWERYNRPSMLQHVESGRPTEIDALNGALVKRAQALGIAVPFNEAIVLAVKGIEAAKKRDGNALDEKALEAVGRRDARNGRWGSS